VSEAWRTVPTAGAELPLSTQLLARDPGTGSRTLLVRFPAGFAREALVRYDVDEDFLVVSGELMMNGDRFLPGDWVDVPAGTVRGGTRTGTGALAVAWFSGAPVPVLGDGDAKEPVPPLRRRELGERPFRLPSPVER
jgi:hypothetical protein